MTQRESQENRALDKIVALDQRLLDRFRAKPGHRPALRALALAMTECGRTPVNIAIIIAIWALDDTLAVAMAACLILSELIAATLKRKVDRMRPPTSAAIRGHELSSWDGPHSFPSAHAQNAAAIWGLLALASPSPYPAFAAVSLALAIGWSRLYLARHYPMDVLAGFLIGSCLAVLGAVALGAMGGLPAAENPL